MSYPVMRLSIDEVSEDLQEQRTRQIESDKVDPEMAHDAITGMEE
jgi:hypothetical protein